MPLLITKLHVPQTRPETVLRPHLIQQLNASRNCKLTLVCAPAGFGKTTLVSAWITQLDRPTAWLRLDQADNNPVNFWQYVMAALQTVEASIGQAIQARLQLPQWLPLEDLAPTLVNELAASPRALTLVLDDYHLIENETIHAGLNLLLDHLPAQLRLVIITRTEPPLALARRRALAELSEVRMAQLRFSLDETVTFLNTSMRLGLEAEDIATLDKRIEGWIAALQMVAVTLQSHLFSQTPNGSNKHRFVTTLGGGDRHIADYLVEEVLLNQPPEIQVFLLQTSILDRFCSALCEAVTGQADSQAILTALERTNLFIEPLDNQRQWYRYHPLFAELLRQRLRHPAPALARKLATPDALHLRASQWYEQAGWVPEAIAHALTLSDVNYAATLIERHAPATLLHNEIVVTFNWLNALPQAVLQASPHLGLYRAWAEMYTSARAWKDTIASADEWFTAFSSIWTTWTYPEAALIEAAHNFRKCVPDLLAFLQGYLHAGDNETEAQFPEVLRQTLAQIPETDLIARSIVIYFLIISARKYQTLIDLLGEAQKTGLAGGNRRYAFTTTWMQALLYCNSGRFDQAARTCQATIESVIAPYEHDQQPLPAAAGVYTLLGVVQVERGELEAAERSLNEALTLTKQVKAAEPTTRRLVFKTLARLKCIQGDFIGALETLDCLEELYPDDEAYAAAFRAMTWLTWTHSEPQYLELASQWAAQRGLAPYEDGRHHWDGFILARLLIAQRRAAPPGSAQPDLGPLCRSLEKQRRSAQETGNVWWEIDAHMLLALAWQAEGKLKPALEAIERALKLAEPGGYFRIFVDDNAPMAALLHQLQKRKPLSVAGYVKRLLAAFPPWVGNEELTASPTSLPVEALTPRETEILKRVANGASNLQIAREMSITLSTVKSHLGNIYGKLGVRNRMQATLQARKMGLVQ